MRKVLFSLALLFPLKTTSAETADLLFNRFVFSEEFKAGLKVASCDVDGDNIDEIIVAPGPGPEMRLRVYGGEGLRELNSFIFEEEYTNVYVSLACGDIDGNGTAEIVLGFEEGAPARIKVFDALSGTLLWSELAWPIGYRDGIRIAVADDNQDGLADIYAVQQGSGNGEVKVFSPANRFKPFAKFVIPLRWNPEQHNSVVLAAANLDKDADIELAYRPGRDSILFWGLKGKAQLFADRRLSETIHSELRIALGDIDNDGHNDIVVAPGFGAAPFFEVHSLHLGRILSRSMAYSPDYHGGLNVACGDVNGDGFDDVIVGPERVSGPHLKVFSGKSLLEHGVAGPRLELRAGVPPLKSADELPEGMTSDGPAVAFPHSGTTTATFQLLSGRIEVFDRNAQKILASRTIEKAAVFQPERRQLFDLTFENNPEHKLDFRVYDGEGFRGVFVRPGISARHY